ncbi:DUF6176 family protein [Chromobacterium sp. IIBBL 290-4]|uniref:DUF6176 family protein n=1 Tax=Chromobacterium sp. IIBBL 290-4 TaxID=2953890 RepID=UPI0020B7EA2C|nr:DUF6176 family protein [Chromobacterium sp. IIBBL 290-4]UTH73384.1 DUF6176 family protein [Chromobacterium sp. IIBBL 290-4]
MAHASEMACFAVKPGKEARAALWMEALRHRRQECVEALAREAMRFEAIFQRWEGLFLCWLSAQGEQGKRPDSSPCDIDAVHLAFGAERIDRCALPREWSHQVGFLPAEVAAVMLKNGASYGE